MLDLFIGISLGIILTMIFDKWNEAKYTIYGSYKLNSIDDTIAVRLNSEQIIRKRSKIILLPKQSHEKHVLNGSYFLSNFRRYSYERRKNIINYVRGRVFERKRNSSKNARRK